MDMEKKKPLIFNNIIYYILLLISSILWGIGHYPDFFFIRFFGLLPFIYIILYRKHYIIESIIFGWLAYIINFWWLYLTFRISGKLPVVFSVGIPLILCLYYSLQYPIIAIIAKKFIKYKKSLMYCLPIIFVTVDYFYPKLFKHSIADSQIGFYYLIQIIDITGMSGLTLIIIYFNIGIFELIKKVFFHKKIHLIHFIFILPFIFALIYGILRVKFLKNEMKKSNTIYAAMIQGNITGKQKQEKGSYQFSIDTYNRLSREAAKDPEIELIIWPESVFTRAYRGRRSQLLELIQENYPPLILGILYDKKVKENEYKTNSIITNSCFLVKERDTYERYDKNRLLAFGEYVPLENIFPFFKKITPLNRSFEKGKTSSIFEINNKTAASLSICFEDIFPDYIRKKSNEGCNILINITNDSWYGDTIGPVHHSVLGRLRAIENRRSFFRCTATGLTTASDFTGKVIAKGGMFKEEVIKARLPLYSKRTIYSYIGESLTYLCLLSVIILLIMIINKKIKNFMELIKYIKILKNKKTIRNIYRDRLEMKKIKNYNNY